MRKLQEAILHCSKVSHMMHRTILRCSSIELEEIEMSLIAFVFLVGVALFLALQAGSRG